jgi:hypothetical protein
MPKIEHIWTPADMLAPSLLVYFPDGAAVVFVDQELIVAIPANQEQTDALANLIDDEFGYIALRDKLCSGDREILGDESKHVFLTNLFRREMEHVRAVEDSVKVN